jgi:hypothetical protein
VIESVASRGRETGGEATVTTINRLSITAVIAAVAVMLVQTAAGAGEPKNEWPFTRPVTTRAQQSATPNATASTVIQGEPKNEWPFTRRVGDRSAKPATRASAATLPPRGEPKNEPPFVQPTLSTASSGGAFNWIDGAVGALAGIGLAVAATGVLLIARKSPQTA